MWDQKKRWATFYAVSGAVLPVVMLGTRARQRRAILRRDTLSFLRWWWWWCWVEVVVQRVYVLFWDGDDEILILTFLLLRKVCMGWRAPSVSGWNESGV